MHPNSADVDSSSIRFQYYTPEVYDEYIREDEKTGKMNNFVRLGLKTEVIYNPERDENGIPTDGGKSIPTAAGSNGNADDEKKKKAALAAAEKEQAKIKADADKQAAAETKRLEKEAKDKAAADKLAAEKEAAAKAAAAETRDLVVNDIAFVVTKGERGYTAVQKDGGTITGEGKSLNALNIDLQGKTKKS